MRYVLQTLLIRQNFEIALHVIRYYCIDTIWNQYAAHWYREVLNHEPENTFCMYRLAVCLADPFEEFNLHPGYGMPEEAYFGLAKAQKKEILIVICLVAWFYEMGNVVNHDYDMAYKYFRIAADNGHEMSAELIKRYRKNIFGNYYIPQ